MSNHQHRNIPLCAAQHILGFRWARTSLFVLFTVASTPLFAATCKSVPPAAGVTKPQPDLNDPCQYWHFVQTMLRQEKWDDLEAFVSRERSTKARFSGGGWKLSSAYSALAYPLQNDESDPPTGDEWQAQAAKLASWVAARPDSITARVTLAKFYVDYAWNARGNEYADLVADNAMKLFAERVAKARNILDAAKLPAKCPESYQVMLEIAQAQGWDLSEQRSLLEAAYRFEPLYYYYYQQHAAALLPQWYGEPGDAETFAKEIADRIGGKQGDIVYFEIAITLGCHCSVAQSQPQSLSWERIKRGYAAEAELYGVGPIKLNHFAKLALAADDRYLAASLFLEIGSQGMDQVWGSKRVFVSKRLLALSLPPDLFAKFDLTVQNYKKAGGLAYLNQFDSDFQSRLDPAVKSCTQSVNREDGAFSVFIQVGAKGEVENAMSWPPTNVSICLLPKVKAQHFAVPPEPGFWTFENVGEAKPMPYAYFGAGVPDIGR